MAANDTFTVAIELGSSKVSVVAGRKEPDGGINILAYLQEPSNNFIRKGRINNVDKMTQFIKSMKERLEKQLKMTVGQVYVGIGGMGMHTVANKVERDFAESAKITEETIESLKRENLQARALNSDILEVIPQEYKVDTQTKADPIGMIASHITGNYLNVTAASSARAQILECFREEKLGIAGTPISVLSLAMDLTSEPERRAGCVVVDMGAETTSVAVYNNNFLRHLAVLPLGGANITRDLATVFNLSEEEAETLKCKYIAAAMDPTDVENHSDIVFADKRTVRFSEFFSVAQARLEEIITNVENQAKEGCTKSLVGGFILTGGMSQMKGIESAFKEFAKDSKVVVRQNLPIQVRAKGEFNSNATFNAVISMLDKNTANCCYGPLDQQGQLFSGIEDAGEGRTSTTKTAEEVTSTTTVFPGNATGQPTMSPITSTTGPTGHDTPTPTPQEATPTEPEKPKTPSRLSAGFLKRGWRKITEMLSEDPEE